MWAKITPWTQALVCAVRLQITNLKSTLIEKIHKHDHRSSVDLTIFHSKTDTQINHRKSKN